MNSEYRSRIILLDLCHPMRIETVKTVIESLENALVWGLSFPLNGLQFGVFVLNSEFKIVQPQSDFEQNYDILAKALEDLQKITKQDTKVTVQKYKKLTTQSLNAIFQEFWSKLKSPNSSNQFKNVSLQIAIVTKKTASVIVEILTDVLKKPQEANFMDLINKFKIVQIVNENEEIYKMPQKNELFECTTCLNHCCYLTYFFKDWLLNPEEHLEILLNEHMNISLKCDVDNYIIKPISSLLDQKLYSKTFNKIPSPGESNPKRLEIVSKIPISRFCPTLIYGFPQRITATLNKTLILSELQLNRQMFKGLCLELQNSGQGLVTRSKIQTDGQEMFTYQFITSDGDILLMNNIAPYELYLPKEMKSLKFDKTDEEAISFVKNCLQNKKLLDEYCPRDFPSGIQECLTHCLIQASKSKIPSKRFNSEYERKFRIKNAKHDQNNTQNKEKENVQIMKKPKIESETTFPKSNNVHPALLPKCIIQKYRKVDSKAFKLPELSQDFIKGLLNVAELN